LIQGKGHKNKIR